jgi:hypothetical protein
MRFRFMMAACVAAVLSLPLLAQAQGIVRGAEEGAAAGNVLPVQLEARSVPALAEWSAALRECLEFRRSDMVRPTPATARIALNSPHGQEVR